MSNLRKRFLALAIVAVMLVAALSSTAFAATSEFADISDAEETKMVKLLSALQIVLGRPADEDGVKNFDRDALVNRQEMAMFLARINSATPGAFNDAEAAAAAKIAFEDVKDSTFFLAIQYCHEQGIITGATAETFNPTDPVTLDQALAMIIRALGYKDIDTSKNFIESTKKAKELGFALTYKDNEGGKKLTRIEVISLLYKYFYSDEQSLEIVKNEFTGVQSVQRVPHPVMAKFGINVQEAYIVRANDYTAVLNYKLEDPRGEEITVTTMKVPQLTAREIAEGKDIILAYPDFKVGSLRTDGTYNYTGKWVYIATSKVELDCADESNRALAGLKVVYYQDTLAATRPVDLGILSYVKGTKTQVDLADKDKPTSAKMNGDLNNFTDYATGLTILGKTYDLRANVNELVDSDIYGFNSKAELLPSTKTNYDQLKQLGGFIAKGGNFGLEYVVNDTDLSGNPTEFYFIFTPYTVAYHNGIQTGNDWKYEPIKLDGSWKDDGDYKDGGDYTKALYTKHPDASKNIKINDIAKVGFESGNAYLYTREGQNLNVFAKLVKRVDKKFPEYILKEKLGLAGLTIDLNGKNLSIALNATTSSSNMQLGSETSAFSSKSDSEVFYVYRHNDGPGATSNKKYGVLTAAPTPVTNYLGTSTYMYMYPVFTYADNRVINMTSEILLSDYNYWETRRLEAGDLVSYQKVGDYYRMGAFDNLSYLYNDRNGHLAFEKGVTVSSANSVMHSFTATNISYSPYNSDIFEMREGDYVLKGIITNNTEILLTEYSDNTFAPENFVTGRKLTKAEFDRLDVPNMDAVTFEMITEYDTTISNALAIHLRIVYDASYNNDMYVTVFETIGNNDGYGNSVLTLAKAYNYLTNTEYVVSAASGVALKVGEVVRINPDRYNTVSGTKYWLANRIATPAAQDAVYRNNAINNPFATRGNFTQPVNVKSSIDSWRGNISLDTLAYRLSNDNNIWAYPIYTSTRGGAVYGRTFGIDGYTRVADGETIALYSRMATIYTVRTGVTTGNANTIIWETATVNVPLYSTDITKLQSTVPALTGTILSGRPTGTSVTVANGARFVEWTTTTDVWGQPVDIDAKSALSKASYTSPQTISNSDDLALIKADNYVATSGDAEVFYRDSTADPLSQVELFEEDTDYEVIPGSSMFTAVSLLNRNKVNYITITLPSGSYSGGSTLPTGTTVEFGRRDWDNGDVPVITNGSGNSMIGSNSSLYKYYVITNNTNENTPSDIVTIIRINIAS